MAVAAAEITLKHFALFDDDARQLLCQTKSLEHQFQLHFVSDVEDSIDLLRIKSGAVIISASGMCDAGRVVRHLHKNLGRRECSVVIAGFQAEGALGRRLVDGEKHVRLLGDDIEVQASMHTLGAFSAHADQKALLDWTHAFKRPPCKVYVVHGESFASHALVALLREQQAWGLCEVIVPQEGKTYKY